MATVEGFGQTAQSVRELSERMQKLSSNVDAMLAAQFGPDRVSIPQFVGEATTTLKGLQKTAQGIDKTAAEFATTATALTATATEVTRMSQRLNAPGGLVDRLSEGASALTNAGQAVSAGTLPRLNRTTEDASRTARQLTRAVNAVSDNPQSLIFGQGAPRPGPGEPGFVIPKGAQ
jgi:phospholipid/cholesterol/gamma-HCH transport system substrate-binding protein